MVACCRWIGFLGVCQLQANAVLKKYFFPSATQIRSPGMFEFRAVNRELRRQVAESAGQSIHFDLQQGGHCLTGLC